jgi:hypothetical protein
MRIILNCCRQAGKTTITGGRGWHTASLYPNSLILLDSPGERQSKELMGKVMQFVGEESSFASDTVLEKTLKNGSRIISLPGTEATVRGYSAPRMIAIDEASRVPDSLYQALRPMMAGTACVLILLSTPFGKTGFFHYEWTQGESRMLMSKNERRDSPTRGWMKIMVKAPCEIVGGSIVQPEPEDDFRQRWKEKGIYAYYSPRHTLDFLKQEFDSMPEWWFRQEYMCEFTDSSQSVFRAEDIERAFMKGKEIDDEPVFERSDGFTISGERPARFDWDRW